MKFRNLCCFILVGIFFGGHAATRAAEEPSAARQNINWSAGVADVIISNYVELKNGKVYEDFEIKYRLEISSSAPDKNRISLIPIAPYRIRAKEFDSYAPGEKDKFLLESLYRMYPEMLVKAGTIAEDFRAGGVKTEFEKVWAGALQAGYFQRAEKKELEDYLYDSEQMSLGPQRVENWVLYTRHFERIESSSHSVVIDSREPGLGSVRTVIFPTKKIDQSYLMKVGFSPNTMPVDENKLPIVIEATANTKTMRISQIKGVEDSRPTGGSLRRHTITFHWK
jgi:hypothetical protein